MKHNYRIWQTMRSKRFLLAGAFTISCVVIISLFFITKAGTQVGAELSYADVSTLGSVSGSVVPASCDSNDWRGSYCTDGNFDTADCHANPSLSFCPLDGYTCEYLSGSNYSHSGSHFSNDCMTKCPGSTNAFYDPFNDPNATACPAIKVRFGKNCDLPWGGTIITGDSRRAWQNSSASTCVSETRTCTNGYLSGSYTNSSCVRTYTGGTGTSCFVAGTKVTMADGTYKNIEDVAQGEYVMSSAGPLKVKEDLRKNYKGQVYAFNGNGHYFVTPNHPFMTTDGWKSINPELTHEEMPDLKVSKLEVGDTLILEGGRTMKLTELDSKYMETTVYNFKLGGNHEYYADGYLVHNKIAY